MTDLLARKFAAHELYTRYAHRVDQNELQKWSELFATDAVFVVRGIPTTGRQAILEKMSSGERTEGVPSLARHIITNVEVDIDGDTAKTIADFLFIVSTTTGAVIEMAGNYYSTLIWQDGDWLFQHHLVDMLVDKRDPSAVLSG